jgi:UDP-N-acetylmuramate dehydrogenase
MIFGGMSNTLVRDKGYDGIGLFLEGGEFDQFDLAEGEPLDTLRVGAAQPTAKILKMGRERGWAAAAPLSGIPGYVGGAIAMNAGSHGQWVSQCLDTVMTMNRLGQIIIRKAVEIPFEYRKCALKDEVILEASFLLPRVAREKTQKILDEYREYRAKTQDLQHASAGCLFKNPDRPGCSSGRLIDEAGLKGFKIGSAQISEKHGNFLINLGGATAFDVKKVIEVVRKEVMAKSGLYLETEVKILE